MKHSTYYKRIGNLLLIILLVATYQGIVTNRDKKEQIMKLQTELKAAEETISLVKQQTGAKTEEETVSGKYQDGSYTGEGNGFGGKITVEVKIASGRIESIKIVSAKKEDAAYLTMASELLSIIEKEQTAEVDTVSGATYTSGGIRDAVKQAIALAEEAYE